MAENLLVTDFLTPGMIEAGRKLLQALDQAGIRITAALWLYLSDASAWRLLLGGPEADEAGPRELFKEIYTAMNALPEGDRIPFDSVSVITKDAPILKVLRGVSSLAPGRGEIRFSRNTIGGTFIEDSYIYRLPAAEAA